MSTYNFHQPVFAPGFFDGLSMSKSKVVLLSTAQLEGMFATPLTILSPDKSGDLIVIDNIVFQMTPGSGAFTGGGAVQFQYHTSPNGVVHAGTIPASVVNSSSAGVLSYTNLGPNVGSSGLTIPAGSSVDITNAGGAFGAGNGSAKVYFRYREVRPF
jgi:hypothetical protein